MGKRIKQIEKTISLGIENMYRIDVPENMGFKVAKLHSVGKRQEQQDAFGVSDLDPDIVKQKGFFAIVADGMGGLTSGEKASMATVISALNYFDTHECTSIPDGLLDMVEVANEQVKEIVGITKGQSGSTMIGVLIKGEELFFVSVGDSRILLIHDEELRQLNCEHNYEMDLMKRVESGEMTIEEVKGNPQRHALTSYIGIPVLQKIDQNIDGVEIFPEDRILMMTDGVYNTLSEEEILSAMDYAPEKAMMNLEMQIRSKNKENQDNYTALLIEIQE